MSIPWRRKLSGLGRLIAARRSSIASVGLSGRTSASTRQPWSTAIPDPTLRNEIAR